MSGGMKRSASCCSVRYHVLLLVLAAVMESPVRGEEPPPPPVVRTPVGSYSGKHLVSGRQHRKLYAFTRIPYAKIPVGHLRFAVSC